MNWLRRYVDNVKTYLPSKLREDVGSELYSTLQDQCDDLADSLGRQPTEADILALLKDKGHPMQVAAAYRPRKTLVNEALFPLYTLVLQWMLAAVAIVNAVASVLSLLGQAQPGFSSAAIGWLGATFNGGIYGFAWVTLAFYLVGESINYTGVFGKWDPRRLPDIVDGNQRISRFESATELVVMLVSMAWLNDLFAATPRIAGGGVSFEFSRELEALIPWLNVAIALNLLMSLSKLVKPYWTKLRLSIDTAINLYWLVLIALLFRLNSVFAVDIPGSRAVHWDMPLTNWRVIMIVVFVIIAYDLGKNVQRYYRSMRSK